MFNGFFSRPHILPCTLHQHECRQGGGPPKLISFQLELLEALQRQYPHILSFSKANETGAHVSVSEDASASSRHRL